MIKSEFNLGLLYLRYYQDPKKDVKRVGGYMNLELGVISVKLWGQVRSLKSEHTEGRSPSTEPLVTPTLVKKEEKDLAKTQKEQPMKQEENQHSMLSWKSNGEYLQGVSEQMCHVAKSFLKTKNYLLWQCGNHW